MKRRSIRNFQKREARRRIKAVAKQFDVAIWTRSNPLLAFISDPRNASKFQACNEVQSVALSWPWKIKRVSAAKRKTRRYRRMIHKAITIWPGIALSDEKEPHV